MSLEYNERLLEDQGFNENREILTPQRSEYKLLKWQVKGKSPFFHYFNRMSN